MATTDGMIARGSGLYTGPAGYIGAGTEYHIDMKFHGLVAEGRFDEIAAILDGMAKDLADDGLKLEFSNKSQYYDQNGYSVAGEVWDPNWSDAKKQAIIVFFVFVYYLYHISLFVLCLRNCALILYCPSELIFYNMKNKISGSPKRAFWFL